MKIKNLNSYKPKSKRYTVALGEGLFLRVNPSGLKSWVLRVYLVGTVRDITLGHYPDLNLIQARQLAHLKRNELNAAPSKGLNFNDAYSLWKRKKRGVIVSYGDEKARIDTHLLPYLKNTPLEQITAPLALNVLIKLDKKLPTLKRCLMRLNEILDLAVCSGLLEHNPCRRLSKVFAQHTPIHRPYIKACELPNLFKELEGRPLWFHGFLIWAIYCGLRPVECVSIRREWIDGNTLNLPESIMKKRRPHRVPLPEVIQKLLSIVLNLRTYKRSHYVFAFGHGGKAVNKQILSKWLLSTSFKGRLCHHGLRATLRTWLHDSGCPFEVAEDALAHLSINQTERAYIRSDFLEQRRPFMEKWAVLVISSYCASCADNSIAKPLIDALKPYLTD